jgi:hypothetical protein
VVSQMCYSGEIVVPRPKLSKRCQKIWSKSCQKVVKKLSKSCQKMVKKLSKSCTFNKQWWGWEVCGVGGEIVVPRPSASASLTGQRQKVFSCVDIEAKWQVQEQGIKDTRRTSIYKLYPRAVIIARVLLSQLRAIKSYFTTMQ